MGKLTSGHGLLMREKYPEKLNQYQQIMKLRNWGRLCFVVVLAAWGVSAPLAKEKRTLADVTTHQAGGNYYCYPWLDATPPPQTPAPEGYEPFHMEHYGRHGSRWHIGYKLYDKSLEILQKAHDNGKLTPLGEKTYEAIKKIHTDSRGREGELSDKGAWQHQQIGRRMVENYPQIFNSNTNLDARSTTVIRSILSMFNALNGIKSMVPDMKIKTDASKADMWYMNHGDSKAKKARKHAENTVGKEFNLRHADKKSAFLKKLINDDAYAKDSIGNSLYHSLLTALLNTQSHSDQPWLVDEIFSPEEVKARWVQKNVGWLLQGGNSKFTDHLMPFTQSNLLRNIIESADTAIMSATPSANLRYGHDTIVMPLTALMELDNFGDEMNDLEALADSGWHDYLVVPMAANIQMVFYRKPGSTNPEDVLVKVLLNEEEVTLPVDRENGPYYKWTDVRKYYMNKIQPYCTEPDPMQ